ncbi:MAG TPA: GNAT family N-acyltransferase [Candidatus Competibacteraceae bacterium]|nr:GNAT family N-acyltransferase [Candidatus Competibacteraceae bacterium]HQA25605.1 GNAT family N-acyltransferase [Candidatus Competibacteraceae bacterium]HQD56456.1 GNAT family N-acyltransferase [Candidatus Competibacteraceae bacterium]
MSIDSLIATPIAPDFSAAALPFAAAVPRALSVAFAGSREEIQAAQRLRYAVFAEEMGATLHNRIPGLDHDRLDHYCQHLIVRDGLGQVVGCTRILTPEAAQRAGGYYSQTEFDIAPVLALPGRFMEIGRTCVHPDYRNGATISTLWSGLAAFIAEWEIDHLIGCASIPLGEDDGAAQALYAELAQRHLVPEALRVRPHLPLPRRDGMVRSKHAVPPLLKAYLRLGAQIGGEPCLDPDFKVADVFILLPTTRIERRYARHFLDRDQ